MSDFNRQIDNVLTYLELSEPDRATRMGGFGMRDIVKLDSFKDALLIFPEMYKYHNGSYVIHIAKPRDVDYKFDFSSCSEGNKEDEICTLSRFRRMAPKDVRGKVTRLYPVVAEHTAAIVKKSGAYSSFRGFFAHTANGWLNVTSGYAQRTVVSGHALLLGAELGLQFNRRYEWTASFSLGGPSVCLVTDPLGAREVFKLRDVPPGKQRRAAIKHWVAQHWRKSRVDASEEIRVRQHLRGATSFNWNGLRVDIKPSQIDLEKNIKLEHERRGN